MDFDAFVDRIIADGISAARESYRGKPVHLEGAVAGFECCRGRDVPGLQAALQVALEEKSAAHRRADPKYWAYACFAAAVEWVCNCVSAALLNQGLPTIVTPTARGFLKAAAVAGTKPLGDA
jgi:hypothetical protein